MKDLTLDAQLGFIIGFYSDAAAIIKRKNPDYAPDGIPLLDMMASCVDSDVTIPQGLWILYRKQVSAIRKHFILNKPLTSEPIESRLGDAANYLALLAFWETYKRPLLALWREHWEGQACECESNQIRKYLCQRCETLRWLDTQESRIAFEPTSSGSTPKAQD